MTTNKSPNKLIHEKSPLPTPTRTQPRRLIPLGIRGFFTLSEWR